MSDDVSPANEPWEIILNGEPTFDSAGRAWRCPSLYFWADGTVTWKPQRP